MGTFTAAIQVTPQQITVPVSAPGVQVVFQPTEGDNHVKVQGISVDGGSGITNNGQYLIEIQDPVSGAWKVAHVYGNTAGAGGANSFVNIEPNHTGGQVNGNSVPYSGYEISYNMATSQDSADNRGLPYIRMSPGMRLTFQVSGITGTCRHVLSVIKYI
jgi:hypothetical protein